MKVTVIGQWGGFPEAGEASSGYLFQHEGYNLLVDCGSAVLSNLQKFISINELNAVITSHYHYDHTADIGPLLYGRQIKTILGEISDKLLIYGHSYDKQALERFNMSPYTEALAYDENDTLKVGPFTITFCETKHPVKCFAMKITDGQKTVVYTADTSYFEELSNFSKNADLIICECNLYSNQDGSKMGHMNSQDAAKLGQKSSAKNLLLTHLPHYGNIQDLKREAESSFKGKVELSSLGWTWQ